MGESIVRDGLQSVALFRLGMVAVEADAIDVLRESGDDPHELAWRHSICDWSLLDERGREQMWDDVEAGFCVDSSMRLKDGTWVWVSTLECRTITLIVLAREQGKVIGKG